LRPDRDVLRGWAASAGEPVDASSVLFAARRLAGVRTPEGASWESRRASEELGAEELAASGMDLLAGADLGMGTVAEEPGRHGQHGHVDDPAGPRAARCGRDARGFRAAGSAAAELDGLDDEKQD
jgi:hypothetical protein